MNTNDCLMIYVVLLNGVEACGMIFRLGCYNQDDENNVILSGVEARRCESWATYR